MTVPTTPQLADPDQERARRWLSAFQEEAARLGLPLQAAELTSGS